ncbi:MAG: hypothetical protein WAX89_00510 [Alphaproteobacteria bacterium]
MVTFFNWARWSFHWSVTIFGLVALSAVVGYYALTFHLVPLEVTLVVMAVVGSALLAMRFSSRHFSGVYYAESTFGKHNPWITKMGEMRDFQMALLYMFVLFGPMVLANHYQWWNVTLHGGWTVNGWLKGLPQYLLATEWAHKWPFAVQKFGHWLMLQHVSIRSAYLLLTVPLAMAVMFDGSRFGKWLFATLAVASAMVGYAALQTGYTQGMLVALAGLALALLVLLPQRQNWLAIPMVVFWGIVNYALITAAFGHQLMVFK